MAPSDLQFNQATSTDALHRLKHHLANKNTVNVGSLEFYGICSAAGALACGIPHFGVTWLDMVKCRLQTNPSMYRNPIYGWRVSVREGGLRSLTLGWSPAFIGYSAQGAVKFALYEHFKMTIGQSLGQERAHEHRTLVQMSAAGCADMFASVLLAPCEATKIRIQTNTTVPNLRVALPLMWKQEGIRAFYKGLGPLLCRQVPYTMAKFGAFEKVNELMYEYVVPKQRTECSALQRLGVTFVSGYIAGIAAVFCGLVFHPPDTILSNLHQSPKTSVKSVIAKLGYDGLWRASFTRVFMVGSVPTAFEWCLYDSLRSYWHMPRPLAHETLPLSLQHKLNTNDRQVNEQQIFA